VKPYPKFVSEAVDAIRTNSWAETGEVIQLMELATEPGLEQPISAMLFDGIDRDFEMRPADLRSPAPLAIQASINRKDPYQYFEHGLHPEKYVAYADRLLFDKLYQKQRFQVFGTKPDSNIVLMDLTRANYVEMMREFETEKGAFTKIYRYPVFDRYFHGFNACVDALLRRR
jgi:hypothetical protein